MLRKVAEGADPKASALSTLQDIFNYFIERPQLNNLSTNYQYSFKKSIEKHILPKLGDRPVSTITTADCLECLNSIQGDAATLNNKSYLVSLLS